MYAPEAFLRVASVLTLLGLATWLLLLNRRSALHLTFATFLVMRSTLLAAPFLAEARQVVEVAAYGVPLVQLLIPFTVPFFLYSFQRCHCIAHVHGAAYERPLTIMYMTMPFILAGLYVLRPSLYAQDLVTALTDPASAAAGPLFAARGLDLLAFALIGVLFYHEVDDAKTPLHRFSYLSVSLGFTLAALYEGLAYPLSILLRTDNLSALTWPYWLSFAWSFLAAAIALRVGGGYSAMLRKWSEPRQRALLRPIRVLLVAALGSVLFVGAAAAYSPTLMQNLYGILLAVWSLALPVLVTYAILRHHLFDIDLKFRLTIKRGAVAAVFVAVFFAASEITQVLAQDRWGPLVGVAASTFLVLFIAPLQRKAERFAEAAVPIATSTTQWSQPERITFYREQVHIAWGDGGLSRKERALLLHLRQRLGLSAEQAEEIERVALGEHWIQPTPGPQATAGSH